MSKSADAQIEAQQEAHIMVYGMENKRIRSRVDGEYVYTEVSTAIHDSLNTISIECLLQCTHPTWMNDTTTHMLDVYDIDNDTVLHTYLVQPCGLTIVSNTVCYHLNIIRDTAAEATPAPQGEGKVSK